MTDMRTLTFPADRSVGMLIINHDGGTETGTARGNVAVPSSAKVGLEMGHGDEVRPADVDAIPTVKATGLALTVDSVDVVALVRLVGRSPSLRGLSVSNPKDFTSHLDDDTVLALRVAHPDLNVNGTWYGPEAVQQLV